MSGNETGAAVNRGNRPLSPHLQIYRLPVTAIMSICHRITGVGLMIGGLALVWWLVAAATGPEYFASIDWIMTSWLGKLAQVALAFSLMYHLCNGVRHLVWDAGWAFDLETARLSDWIVLGASGVLTLIVVLIGLFT